MRFVILRFFAEVLRQMAQDLRSICGPSLKGGDATGTAPSVAAFHTYNDVFIEESALL